MRLINKINNKLQNLLKKYQKKIMQFSTNEHCYKPKQFYEEHLT